MEKKYWQNFGELNQSEASKQNAEKEFQEELLPFEELDDKGLMDAKTPAGIF
jgi:molybdopterin-containing oxidoreductase family iron-sulfur binding subunit